jgi:hypothetical protein
MQSFGVGTMLALGLRTLTTTADGRTVWSSVSATNVPRRYSRNHRRGLESKLGKVTSA